ncbi:MAG: DUF3368 domain-containing protein [Candidatus Ornithomonoglobus sp.]
MIVVSDTTPLITLLKVNKLELLDKLFKEVIIPRGVYDELTSNLKYTAEISQIQNCSFIKCIDIEDQNIVNRLRKATGLDKGESEAIVLIDSFNDGLLLMDEKKGRSVAKQMGLKYTGSIGILQYRYIYISL